MNSNTLIATVICALLAATSASALAQKKGASAQVTFGTVEGAQRVKLDAEAGKGALLGGALGWAIARNQSSGRQAAAAAVGAGLGAASRESREGGMGMKYTVRTSAGSAITVVTDQTEVRIGDCVSVEQKNDTANIRRVDNDLCQPASPAVHEAVKPEIAADAERCHQAKERLFEAKTTEEVEVARQIMEAFCND